MFVLVCPHFTDRYLESGWGHMPFLPIWERQRHSGLALTRVLRDPHGAVELVPSAAVGQRDLDGHPLLTMFLGREGDFRDRM